MCYVNDSWRPSPPGLTSAASLAARVVISPMPTPTNERQALERELGELPANIDQYQRELDATLIEAQERRERLEWQIRRVKKRMAEIQARLAR